MSVECNHESVAQDNDASVLTIGVHVSSLTLITLHHIIYKQATQARRDIIILIM